MAAFSVVVLDNDQVPVVSASVGIFSLDGIPIMSTSTDVDGVALLVTLENEVSVVLGKPHYDFGARSYIRPNDGDVFELNGNRLGIAPPNDVSLCRVYGTIRDSIGHTLHPKWKFNIKIKDQVGDKYSDDIIMSSARVPHDSGFVMIDLLKETTYTFGPLPISVNSDVSEYDMLSTVDIRVPDRSTAKLVDLIALKAQGVTLSEDTISIAADKSKAISIEVVLSNDQIAAQVFDYIDLTSSSEDLSIIKSVSSITVSSSVPGVYSIDFYNKRAATTLECLFYRPQLPEVLATLNVEIF